MKLILVCGVIGSGKDYFVNKYREEHPQEVVVEKKFALPIRLFCGKLKGLDFTNEATYEEFKAVAENRQFLVDVGQYMKDVMGEDIWAKGVFDFLTEDDKTYIISDFRFPVEFTSALSYGFDMRVHFCNYHSDRYIFNPKQISETMACWLVHQGYENGQEWNTDEFIKILIKYDGITKNI